MRATPLPIRIDGSSGPLQEQIYHCIRGAIVNGQVLPGRKLPSSRALAHSLGVSRTTTLSALEQLRAEGYLVARHGSGTFVTEELPDERPLCSVRYESGPAHPPVSRRGRDSLSILPAALRVPGPPRPFRPGTPALDLFPIREWSRIVQRRLSRATSSMLDYSDPAGAEELRRAIAEHVRSRGTSCDADQILIVAGTRRGLDLISHLLLDPGDWVWMEDPGFPNARAAFRNAGLEVLPVPVDSEGLDVDAAILQKNSARLAYVSPSNQFPLGVPMSAQRRRKLIEWAHSANAWIVEDDYDCEFRYEGAPIHCMHGLDPDGRVIYAGTFSKSLFPSLRLGFLVLPRDIRPSFLEERVVADFHTPVLDQLVLADFMHEGHYERHLRRMRAAYRERLDALTTAAVKHCHGALTLRPVRGGLHAVADVHGASADVVFREAYRRSVEVVSLTQYHFGRGQPDNALLLGFGSVRPEAFDAGMMQLAAALEAARREGPSARCDLHAIYGRPPGGRRLNGS
jgi:GntR family transcriptional regulator / MocR family aminotransferase